MVRTVLTEGDTAKIKLWVQSHSDSDPVTWGEFKKFLKWLRDELYSVDPDEII